MLIREVFQKFCTAQPFSIRGNTVMLNLHTHVTEGILSAHAKFRSNPLKITY